MGYCYGRILPIERGYRQLVRYQQQLEFHHRLLAAKQIVVAKLKDSRIILQRIHRKRLDSETVAFTIKSLECLSDKASRSETIERLMGLEGAGQLLIFQHLANVCPFPNLYLFSVPAVRQGIRLTPCSALDIKFFGITYFV